MMPIRNLPPGEQSGLQRPGREGLLLALGTLTLVLALAYWRAISTYRAPYRLVQDQPIPAWVDQLYAGRWVVRGAMVAAAAVLVGLEWRGRTVSRALKSALSRPPHRIVLLVLMTLAGRSYLLAPGRIALYDGIANVSSVLAVRQAFELGNLPPLYWSNFFYTGMPWLQFHNSAFYYQGAALDLILRDAFLSTKLTVLANHAAAVYMMYVFVRHISKSTWAALTAATVWAVSFYHYHLFVHLGSAHLSVLLPLLPAVCLCAEAIFEARPKRRAVAGLALTVGLLLWGHPFYGALTAALGLAYAMARLIFVPRRFASLRTRMAACGLILAGILVGGVTALSQWLPPLLERNLVSGWEHGLDFANPPLTWQQMLIFREAFLSPEWWTGYVGWSILGLALGAVALAVINKNRRAAGLIVWLALSAYLSLGPRYLPFNEIMRRIPFGDLVYVIDSSRYLLFGEFALAALAGLFVREIGLAARQIRRKVKVGILPGGLAGRTALLASSLVGAQMVFLTLQVNSLFPESWVGIQPGRGEVFKWLRANGDATSRLLDLSLGGMEAPALSGQPSFVGHREELVRATGFADRIAAAVRDDISRGNLRTTTRAGLYVLNVRYLATAQAVPSGEWRRLFEGSPISLWQLEAYSPVLIAPALTVVSKEDRSILELMKIDPSGNSADFIPVTDRPGSAQPVVVNLAPQAAVSVYEVDLNRVLIRFMADTPGFLQVSQSAFPYVQVYLDGRQVKYFSTAFGLIALHTPAGEHTLELRAVLSPLRKLAYGLDLLGMLAVLVIATWGKVWRSKRASAQVGPVRRIR